MQLIIDERADAKQRDALLRIMTGQDTEDMATGWAIFAAMCPTKLEPLFKRIEFEVDVEKRQARLVVPGLLEAVGEPIRNPVTGAEHGVRIDMPQGFEYRSPRSAPAPRRLRAASSWTYGTHTDSSSTSISAMPASWRSRGGPRALVLYPTLPFSGLASGGRPPEAAVISAATRIIAWAAREHAAWFWRGVRLPERR